MNCDDNNPANILVIIKDMRGWLILNFLRLLIDMLWLTLTEIQHVVFTRPLQIYTSCESDLKGTKLTFIYSK